jgi:hypothetical protein
MRALDFHDSMAARHRDRASELAGRIERLLVDFDDLPNVPLDVLDRVERAIVKAHTANLLRLSNGRIRKRVNAPSWADAGLHDLGCMGPASEHGCTCQPTYVRDER